MKKRLWLVMLVMALALGMMAIGCDNGTGTGDLGTALVGTWGCCCIDDFLIVFDRNGTFRQYDGLFVISATWTTSGNLLILTNVIFSEWDEDGPPPDRMEVVFSISGNTLTLDLGDGDIETFTRRQ